MSALQSRAAMVQQGGYQAGGSPMAEQRLQQANSPAIPSGTPAASMPSKGR